MLSEDEKQAIEKLKKIREDTIKANECGLSNNDFKEEIEVYNTVLNLITKLQKENKEKDRYIKNKDKQIDLMAKFIENNMSEKKIINEICIKSKCNNEECHEDDLKDCIKQYFANKVNSKIQ